MNAIELNENWQDQKEKLKLKFAALTDYDLIYIDGKKDIMLAKLEIKLGKTKEELLKLIHAL